MYVTATTPYVGSWISGQSSRTSHHTLVALRSPRLVPGHHFVKTREHLYISVGDRLLIFTMCYCSILAHIGSSKAKPGRHVLRHAMSFVSLQKSQTPLALH